MTDPRRFSEKVNWRVVRDRREILAWTGDKLAMREEAARRRPDIRIPRTSWVGTDVAELTSVELPARWILKPNNSCGRVYYGHGAVDRDEVARLRAATADWLDTREFVRLREWAYLRARPVLLVEEFIGSAEVPPPDFKIFVFDGVPRFIQVVRDRLTLRLLTFFTPEWEQIRVTSMEPSDPDMPRPRLLDRLLEVAADLGRGFDHIRVDLYAVDDEIWFGEFTPYSWSGLDRIEPVEVDLAWGDHWRLPDL